MWMWTPSRKSIIFMIQVRTSYIKCNMKLDMDEDWREYVNCKYILSAI